MRGETVQMKINKITHSKCPYCKKYGLPFYKTSYKYNPVITCKFCNKKFKVSRILSMTVLILGGVAVGTIFRKIDENWFDMPTWLWCSIGGFLWLIFQYFAPLKEYKEQK